MRRIDLGEYQRSEPYGLSVPERNALKDVLPSITIEPASDTTYCTYHLTPASTVGAFEVETCRFWYDPRLRYPNSCRSRATRLADSG